VISENTDEGSIERDISRHRDYYQPVNSMGQENGVMWQKGGFGAELMGLGFEYLLTGGIVPFHTTNIILLIVHLFKPAPYP